MARIQELYEKLVAFRQKHGPHAFAKHYRQPEQIARLVRDDIDTPASLRAKSEEEFHAALLASGLVKAIKPPRTTPVGERRLMRVKGEPLSETIIENRGESLE